MALFCSCSCGHAALFSKEACHIALLSPFTLPRGRVIALWLAFWSIAHIVTLPTLLYVTPQHKHEPVLMHGIEGSVRSRRDKKAAQYTLSLIWHPPPHGAGYTLVCPLAWWSLPFCCWCCSAVCTQYTSTTMSQVATPTCSSLL
jgi:hypothetical protein